MKTIYLYDGNAETLMPITAAKARGLIGQRVAYLRRCDIDHSGRGYVFPNTGTVNEQSGRNVRIGESWLYFREIAEMCLYQPDLAP